MAHSLSAQKRIRQNEKRNHLNRWRKARIKNAVKAFEEALHSGDKAKAEETYKIASIALDKVASKGTIHKKTASRKKSRLAARLNAIEAK